MVQDAARNKPGDLIGLVLDGVATGRLTGDSGIRLIFVIHKAWEKGYCWWKRASLAKHWRKHVSTITRDFNKWRTLGYVKIRPNPFKASAHLLIFAWLKLWDDELWNDPEKVASMLPELERAFRKGRIGATQKGRIGATYSPPDPLYEGINPKEEQPADPISNEPAESSKCESVQDESLGMAELLKENGVRFTPGEIDKLFSAGRAQGLSISGIFAFVAHKLQEKRNRHDPVYSIQLLIRVIGDRIDLYRWGRMGRQGASFFEQGGPHTGAERNPLFTIEVLREFLARNTAALARPGFEDFAEELGTLDVNALYSDLEQLEQRLIAIEGKMIARLRETASEETLSDARRALDRDLKPYRRNMTVDQLAMLEKQFLGQRLLEAAGVPRLSLFYL